MLFWYLSVLTVVFGLCMGSFLHCCAWRRARGMSFLRGRSQCFACGHPLGAADLIPLFSYLFQRGRCRYCHAKIPLRYPLAELVTAGLYVFTVCRFGFTPEMVLYLLLISILLLCTMVDLDTFLIPNCFLWTGAVGRLVYDGVCVAGGKEAPTVFLTDLFRGAMTGILFLLLVLLCDHIFGRETMGGGDIRLYAMLGMYFDGREMLLLVLLSCLYGILFGLVWNRKTTADARGCAPFPFGAAISTAAVTVLFFGEPIVTLYTGLWGL